LQSCAHPLLHERRGARDNAAKRRPMDQVAADELFHEDIGTTIDPRTCGNVRLLQDAFFPRKSEMGVRISDVEEKDHARVELDPFTQPFDSRSMPDLALACLASARGFSLNLMNRKQFISRASHLRQ
jgi:hypothetical protein